MKVRPMLFSAPMVRALLDGSKTQTRRVVKPQPAMNGKWMEWRNGKGVLITEQNTAWTPFDKGFRSAIDQNPHFCPYGQPGDRLWVRENGWERPERTPKMMREGADTWEPYYFDADGLTDQDSEDFKAWGFKRRPSIHMPRTASRITLEITGVRVERLQEISEADARAEGARECDPVSGREVLLAGPSQRGSFVLHYRDIWEKINGEGSWEANPWVWVVEFKKVTS